MNVLTEDINKRLYDLIEQNPKMSIRQLAKLSHTDRENVRLFLYINDIRPIKSRKYDVPFVLVCCPICERYFYKRIHEVFRTKYDFCSNVCRGKWMGDNYGICEIIKARNNGRWLEGMLNKPKRTNRGKKI